MDYKEIILKKYIDFDKVKQEISSVPEKDYYISYIEITKKLVKTLRRMCIYSPIEIKIAYEYLLYNGYLSVDKKFKYSNENRINDKLVPGIDIMRGTGVCLNISDLLKYIYKSYGYKSEIISCKIKNNNKVESKRLLEKYGYRAKFVLENIVGTHVITMVNKNNSTILCDTTNQDFINLNSKLSGNFLINKVPIKLLPNFFSLINNNKSEMINLLKQTKKLDVKKIYKIYEGIFEFLESKENELNNFHETIKNDIDIICKTLK